MNATTERIRALNAELRHNLPNGHAVMTAGIAALGPEAVARIVKTIAVYSAPSSSCPLFPACSVLGGERSGVSLDVIEAADAAVAIPMLGMANSLNVATTAAIQLPRAATPTERGLGHAVGAWQPRVWVPRSQSCLGSCCRLFIGVGYLRVPMLKLDFLAMTWPKC
jgi:SpoU rRNA Methylase family